jgi:hypothetical protein
MLSGISHAVSATVFAITVRWDSIPCPRSAETRHYIGVFPAITGALNDALDALMRLFGDIA